MPERMTKPTLRLLAILLGDPCREWYGLELMELADLPSGTAYPMLHRLEADGWLISTREAIDPANEGRPKRRLYRLTGLGEAETRRVVAARNAPPTAVGRPTLELPHRGLTA